jgi:hypothetical protein
MPIIRVARPFTFNRGHHVHPKWRFGIGWYDVLDPDYTTIVSTPGIRWHLDVEVIARGEVLMQHRDPQAMWAAGSRYYRSLSIVQNIEAREILIWRWPAWHRGATHFPFHRGRIEAAPGAIVTVLAPVVDADGKHGHWEKQLRPATYNPMPHGEHYSGHHDTGATVGENPIAAAFPSPVIGDVYVGGVPSGAPLKFDSHPPAIPEEPERVRHLRHLQQAAIARAQTGRQWPQQDVGPDLERQAMARVPGAAARPLPTATAVEGFRLDHRIELTDV